MLRSKMKKKCNTGRHQSDVEDTKQVHEGDSHPTYMPPREAPGIRQAYNPNPEGDDKHYAIKVPDGLDPNTNTVRSAKIAYLLNRLKYIYLHLPLVR